MIPGGQSYHDQQRQIKTAEQSERQRILQLLENDKAERRLRERERKGEYTTPTPTPTPSASATPSSQLNSEAKSQNVALAFRLVDGTSIKSRFPSSAVLGEDVRAWIETVGNPSAWALCCH